MLALLDERERNQQYIKRRDRENEEIALTVGSCALSWKLQRSALQNWKAEPVSQTYKLNELSGNYPVTPDGWITAVSGMPAQDDWILILFKARRVYGRTGTRGIRGVERRHFIVVRERLVLDASTGTAAGG